MKINKINFKIKLMLIYQMKLKTKILRKKLQILIKLQ